MENIKLNRDIIEKLKRETPDLIKEFMHSDLVKMILYGSCARGDFSECSDVDIATKLALKYFAIVNFVLLPYDEFEEKKGWYGYFKNIDREGVKLYG